MAKKSRDVNELLRYSQSLLDDLNRRKKEVKQSVRQNKGCKNHPSRLIYRAGLCVECDTEKRNLLNKQNAQKEPWESTDGYMKIYREDGTIAQYHRYVIEQALNRRLRREETVKFMDSNRLNCSLENLRLVCEEGVDLSSLICVNCGQLATKHCEPSTSPLPL